MYELDINASYFQLLFLYSNCRETDRNYPEKH